MLSFACLLCPVVSLLAAPGAEAASAVETIVCQDRFDKHLQGIAADRAGSFYWSFTTALVKTDRQGKVLRRIPVANHHGDLCFCEGRLYVAVNLGKFNEPPGKADSWVYVYRDDLTEVARHALPELVHGAGAIGFREGRYFVAGGLPVGVQENYVYEYDGRFKFQTRHVLPSGYTLMGIQTARFAEGYWWFGCYGLPPVLLKADAELKRVERFSFDAALGIESAGDGRLWVASRKMLGAGKQTAELRRVKPDAKLGLVTAPQP